MSVLRYLLVLCAPLLYDVSVAASKIVFPTIDVFATECQLPNNLNGTCLNLKYCPSAITARNVSMCYEEGVEQIVCCNNDLWSEMKTRPLTAGCGVPRFSIIRGLQTAYKEFPYMVALGWESLFADDSYDYKCGGVLISSKYVLTAAHCARLNGLSPSVVLVGGANLTDSSNKPLKIVEVLPHPDYKHHESYHDIALLKLEKDVMETPICAWSLYSMDDTNVTAIGYGHTQFAGPSSETLLKTHLSIVPNRECSSHFSDEHSLPHGLLESQFCAKDWERNSDTCQGDSGGPIILHSTSQYGLETPFVVGITSFGRGCAMDPPGVYTRVSEYIDWIEAVVFNK